MQKAKTFLSLSHVELFLPSTQHVPGIHNLLSPFLQGITGGLSWFLQELRNEGH